GAAYAATALSPLPLFRSHRLHSHRHPTGSALFRGRAVFLGRASLQGEGVDRAFQLLGQNLIDQTLALDLADSVETGGSDLDPKMSLAFGTGAAVAGMEMRFVGDGKPRGCQRRGKLFFDG